MFEIILVYLGDTSKGVRAYACIGLQLWASPRNIYLVVTWFDSQQPTQLLPFGFAEQRAGDIIRNI